MERTVDIAYSNLDFFAFTGNSQWHDIGAYPMDLHKHWLDGFDRHRRMWPANLKLIEEVNEPGRFAAFAGYEWHSSAFGDYNIIFPDDRAELGIHPDLDHLAQWARTHDALLIPHHLGYPTGARGANWQTFVPDVAPVVEVFSEHGACERDEGPYPYVRHGLGARMSGNSYQGALERGLIVGAVAGTDTHVGAPGAYAQGLTAVLADRLDREALFEALRARRTYAVTGDRIGLDFRVDDAPMGSVLGPRPTRNIRVDVNGLDRIRSVELIRNNEVIHEQRNINRPTGSLSRRTVVRAEFGWGPWADLAIARVCDWEIELRVVGGAIAAIHPCFCGEPFDENRRNLIVSRDAAHCRWTSYTSRSGAFEDRPNGIVFELDADAHAHLQFDVYRPVRQTFGTSLDLLKRRNEAHQTDGFQSELVYLHQALPATACAASVVIEDNEPTGRPCDFYYARVTQDNGQMAWSSPIWVSGR